MQRRELLRLSFTLLGTAASATVSRALLAGITAGGGSDGTPFTDDQARAVSLLCEIIIPTTDTPGAVAAGVPQFIETIYSQWYRDGERQKFLQGLADLDSFCEAQSGTTFTATDDATRVAALREQERLAKDYSPPAAARLTPRQPEDENAPFFNRIKELVVLGYYTSEIGCKQEQVYLPMPGRYDGDYDFAEAGRHFTH